MSEDYLKDLFSEIVNEVQQYTTENEQNKFLELLTNTKTDNLMIVLENLLPNTRKNSYTLDRDIVNVIDFISSRLLPKKIKKTRSDIVNEFLDFARLAYKEDIDEYKCDNSIADQQGLNKEYSRKFFEIIRGEAGPDIIKKFGFEKEYGKQGLRLDLSIKNIEFLEAIKDLQKNAKISQTLNDILKAILRKKLPE